MVIKRKTEAHVLRWHFEKEIKGPDDEVECTATYYTGQLDVDYEGTYNIVDDKGKIYSFPTSGVLSQVVFLEAVVNVKPLNRKNENRELDGDDSTEYSLPQPSQDQTEEQGVKYDENTGDGFGEANDGPQEKYEEDSYRDQEETEEQAAEENYEEKGNRGHGNQDSFESQNQDRNEYGSYGQQTEGQEYGRFGGGY